MLIGFDYFKICVIQFDLVNLDLGVSRRIFHTLSRFREKKHFSFKITKHKATVSLRSYYNLTTRFPLNHFQTKNMLVLHWMVELKSIYFTYTPYKHKILK